MRDTFYTRSQIAAYLGISRMTLNRWEKIVPIKIDRLGYPVRYPTRRTVKEWFHKLQEKYRPKQWWQVSARLE